MKRFFPFILMLTIVLCSCSKPTELSGRTFISKTEKVTSDGQTVYHVMKFLHGGEVENTMCIGSSHGPLLEGTSKNYGTYELDYPKLHTEIIFSIDGMAAYREIKDFEFTDKNHYVEYKHGEIVQEFSEE